MENLKEKILEIIKQPQLSGFATVKEDGTPWVRYVIAVGNDDMEIRFATFTKARKVAQIEKNNKAHLTCGVNDPANLKPYLQISGIAELTTEQNEKNAFWNPELENIFSGPDDENYGVIIVKPYEIEYTVPGNHTPFIWKA